MTSNRIAVLGVGAIGGAIAADLADLARHEMQLCTRTAFTVLEVEHASGTSVVRAPVVTDPELVTPADWILLATKAHQSEVARPFLEALCQPHSVVAVLQNGVDHEARIGPLVPAGVQVLPVVVALPAEKLAPGRVEQSHAGRLVVPASDAGRAFARLFDGGRTQVLASEDFVSQAWWKLLNNAALGGVCVLSLRENSVARDPEVRALIIELMREVLAVARAEGADLPDDAPEKALQVVLDGAPGHWSSITVDRREGRNLEWRARNAIVGERARRHGIATPLNDVVTTLLRAADGGLG
jgi:2-dehydropantoate 2-reductase